MGLKDTLQKGALLGATMLAVNVGAIDNKTETDVRPKIEQKSVRDYSHLVDENKCVKPNEAVYLKGLVSLMARVPTGKKLLDLTAISVPLRLSSIRSTQFLISV